MYIPDYVISYFLGIATILVLGVLFSRKKAKK